MDPDMMEDKVPAELMMEIDAYAAVVSDKPAENNMEVEKPSCCCCIDSEFGMKILAVLYVLSPLF